MQIGECEMTARAEDLSRADEVPTARVIRLDLSEQEAIAAAALFDVAVKAAGLQVAQTALHLTQRLKAATAAANLPAVR
jgi:hypothetical protein